MKLTLSLIALILICSCNRNSNPHPGVLNKNNLPSQLFSIDVERDTTILSTAGVIIKIPAGSIESRDNPVKIEYKEALDIASMVFGGLTTRSKNNEVLSSAGMMYLGAADGSALIIKKEIEMLVPTKTYNPDMQIWKGEKTSDGTIVWQEPVPLPDDETTQKITNGENLFKVSCASCHKINEDFTGPSLAGVTYRRPKKWLYDFTRDPLGTIAMNNDSTIEDYYLHCLLEHWKPTVMTAYPSLTDQALDELYGYIKAETDKLPIPVNRYATTCCDSCELVRDDLNKIYKIKKGRDSLVNDNGKFFTLDREIPIATGGSISDDGASPTPQKNYVVPIIKKATYYTLKVTATGWYNIDILLKNYSNCIPSELFVRIKGEYKIDFNVSLIIPDYKAYVEGGKLKDGVSYGFDETNGRIPLPQGAVCTVIAFAEYEGKILFGKTVFNATTKQTLDLSVRLMNKEEMQVAIAKMGIDDINFKVDDSKNADEIRNTDKLLDSLKQRLPENCNCIGL